MRAVRLSMPRFDAPRFAMPLAPRARQQASLLALVLVSSLIAQVARAESAPPRDLTVREWVVESIDGRGVVGSSRSTLTFDAQGQLAGLAGCNRYTAAYRLHGAQLEVKGLVATRMSCVPALMDQEVRFLKVLATAGSWHLQRDGKLNIVTADGRRLLAH